MFDVGYPFVILFVVIPVEPLGSGSVCAELTFRLPDKLQKYVCKKGSIAIDGISLTVNNVEKKSFSVSIIPHTSAITTLGDIQKDDTVNIEIDILARYIENNIKKIK